MLGEDIIICENLVKIYKTKDLEVLALQGLELNIAAGELMAIIGNSGSGKSTFLNMVGGLDRPSAGKLTVDGKNLFKLNERELVEYKRNTVGFVWQNNARNLLPYLSAYMGHAHFSATAYYIHLVPDFFSELSGMDLDAYGELLPEVPHEC